MAQGRESEQAGAILGAGALRRYQLDGIEALRASLRAGHRRPILVAPTGSGKTVLAAEIVRMAQEKSKSVLFLAPRRELIAQASARFAKVGIQHGIIMAGEPRSLYARVQVASFDTLHARGVRTKRMLMPQGDLVIVDEAHLSVADTRKAIIDHYADSIVIGLTATPARGDGRGLGGIYDDLVPITSIRELTDNGYLAEARYFAPTEPDLAGIKLNKDGDYQEKQLGKRMDQPQLVGGIVENWTRLAWGMSTVVFCVTRAHSRHVCEQFLRIGVTSEHLDGETPLDERKAILARVASGETTVLCNVFVATFGLDIPRLACAVLARPTRNIALYLQIIGRVLRTAEGKNEAFIIDHSGAVAQHGFADEFVPWSLDEKETVAERRKKQREANKSPKEITCAKCKTVFKGRRECPGCGHAMVPRTDAVPFHKADLEEVKPVKENRDTTWEEKQAFMAGLKAYAAEHDYAHGWVAHKYRTRFGVWPDDPRVRDVSPMPYDDATRKWITSQNIRHAKRRAA
jgi:DNA repair protein RadD